MWFSKDKFREALKQRLEEASLILSERIGNEELYVFSIWTSHEADFSYLSAAANTEEALLRAAKAMAEKHPEQSLESYLIRLRWSPADWAYQGLGINGASLKLPKGEGASRDAKIYSDLVAELRPFRDKSALARFRSKLYLLIVTGDMSDAYFQKGLKALNPEELVESYLNTSTAEPQLRELRALPEPLRLQKVMELYEGLWLQKSSGLLTQFDLGPLLVEMGPVAADRLLDIVEAHGLDALVEKSPMEGLMVSASVLMVSDFKKTSADQRDRLRKIVAKRVELDRGSSRASTLAENAARVLHRIEPNKYPMPKMNSRTNHLENSGDFIE